MKPWIIVLIVLAVIAVILGLLYYFGKKAQTKQAAQQEQMEAMKQTVSMLIIDKKKLRMKDSGLPQMVIDQTPKMMRRAKLPIVKAKVGPRIMTLICDAAIFDQIPVKKEVKATVSGIYITGVRCCSGIFSSVVICASICSRVTRSVPFRSASSLRRSPVPRQNFISSSLLASEKCRSRLASPRLRLISDRFRFGGLK